MTSASAPGRRGGYLVVAIIAWLVLVLAAAVCVGVTWAGMRFAFEVTCAPNRPPVVFRMSVTLVGMVVCLACVFWSRSLLVRGSQPGAVTALFLAFAALVTPLVTFLIPVFVAGLC